MSPLDNRPHVIVVYTDDGTFHEDNGRWVAKVIGPFPTRPAAEAVNKRLAAYFPSTIEHGVVELEPPLPEDVQTPCLADMSGQLCELPVGHAGDHRR